MIKQNGFNYIKARIFTMKDTTYNFFIQMIKWGNKFVVFISNEEY